MQSVGCVIRLAIFATILINWCSAKYFIAAPNLVRLGVQETVSVTVFGVDRARVKIYLQDFPHRRKTFSAVEADFVRDKPGNLLIQVNAQDLSDQQSLDKQYVYLVATSSTPGLTFKEEIPILVSYRNSMVFIQTDKPIYTPGQTVQLRVIPLDIDLKSSLNNVTIEMMNPQGVRVDRWSNLNTNEGFFSRRKDLSENAILGNWTVSALYGHGLVQNATIQFEVREYILPTFSVKIDGPRHILESDTHITIKVTSEYTYGKGVLGSVQLSLAVYNDPGNPPVRFHTSFIELDDGKAEDVIMLDILKNRPDNLWFPDGKRLFVEAKVTEKATGKQEEAIENTIYFAKSPYKISFKRTPNFFKPGVPFEIKVDVTYMNGKPAVGVNLELEAKTDKDDVVQERQNAGAQNTAISDRAGHGSFVVDVPKKYTIQYLNIVVRTRSNPPSEFRFQPTMYTSPGNNYLFVRVPKGQVGNSVHAEAFALTKANPSSLSYLVVARGRIQSQGTIVRNLGVVTTFRIDIISSMSPQARLIVYYAAGNEIVVDSTVLEVVERFPNEVKFLGDANPTIHPSFPYRMQIQGDPYSRIGILAVDQSVYLLRDDKQLTFDAVFQRMKSHDLGCGWGGGQNNEDVLKKSGLAVMTGYGLKTTLRDDYKCSAASRKRRSIMTRATKICCHHGKVPSTGSCLFRAKEFSKNVSRTLHPISDCVLSFYKCCKELYEPRSSRGRMFGDDIPADLLNNINTDFDDPDSELDDVQLRTNFPETWLYEDRLTGKNGMVDMSITVPHTITTWVIHAIAVSNTTGFGLTPPHFLKTFKQFFISLSLPYSAQRGEQVTITATVYNYDETDDPAFKESMVRLRLAGSRDYCSSVQPDKNDVVAQLKVKQKDAQSFSFTIVPLVLRDIFIRVTAHAASFSPDSTERSLKILPEGKQRRKSYSTVLDPQGVLKDPNSPTTAAPTTQGAIKTATKGQGEQKNSMNLTTPASTVRDSASAKLTVIGNLIGPVVANVIEGRGLDSMILLPTGCGEQTMLKLAPNVFVLQYLRSTKQVTPQIESTAFNFIKSGYQRELNYRRTDQSFSAFGNSRAGSTWLTAFVAKTFCAAQKFGGVDIDEAVICGALTFLSGVQRGDGGIPEHSPVIHQEMNGDINGEIAMTAYVLTAFMECQCPTVSSSATINNAVTYLENNRPRISRVYVKAVVAYALALASSPQKFAANNELLLAAHYDPAENVRYWTDGGNAINVETTSYVLLTQIALGRITYAGPIVVWLTQQRKGGGGFVSTQDTCLALQALAAYSQNTGGDRLDLAIEVTSSLQDDYKRTLRVNKRNALVQQQLDISDLIGEDIYITTTGSGVAQLQIETIYNTPPSEAESCQFELTVDTVESGKARDPPVGPQNPIKRPSRRRGRGKRRGRGRGKGRRRGRKNKKNKKNTKKIPKKIVQRDHPMSSDTIVFKVCVRAKKVNGTGMSIIDIGILTGFSADEDSVKDLKNKHTPGIKMYEISDRHLVLYLESIPDSHALCFPLKMKRLFEVGMTQPVPVIVYDYYEPDVKCTTFYGPKDDSALKLALCDEDKCKCLLDKCTSCSSWNNVNSVLDSYCSDYNYAFKGEVRGIDERDNILKIKVDVLDVYKTGTTNFVRDMRIEFMKISNCDCPRITSNEVDKHFLFMGSDRGVTIRQSRHTKISMDNRVFVKEWKTGSRFFNRFTQEVNQVNYCY